LGVAAELVGAATASTVAAASPAMAMNRECLDMP
jgi:hypothetical protein